MNVLKPIELEIKQDWSRIIASFQQVHQLWKRNQLRSAKYDPAYETNFYELGALGSLQSLDNLCVEDQAAAFLHGKIIETDLSWLSRMSGDFGEIGMAAVCLFASNQNIKPHRDFDPDNKQQGNICKIHYVLCDSDATIHVDDQSFTCQANTAWLMNVEHLHWMTTNDWVYTFQISFHRPFQEVAAWFDNHEKFVY